MTERAGQHPMRGVLSLALCAITVFGYASCANRAEKARLAVEEYLRNQGVQEVKLTLFCTTEAFPGKAYVSVMVTHNFANASGEPQKEYLGYIMKQDGKEWRVERSAVYTKEEQHGLDLLAGRKQ